MPIAWPARLRGRLTLALAASLALHLLAGLGLYLLGRPVTIIGVKRGEPLFVELPETPDRAPAGNPAERRTGPPAVEARRTVPPPVRPAPGPAPRSSEPARTAPPPPVVASQPPAVPAARPAPPPEPSVPASPPATAPRPEPAPAPPPPLPASPPAAASRPEPVPLPATPPTPEGTLPAPAPAVAAAPASPPVPSDTGARPAPPAPSSGSAGVAPLVAAVPPGAPAPPPPVDIRSALRRGGAGGRGDGRGGIEGEPIPLDTADARYSEYFDRVRRMIKERWGYPCVKNVLTRECEYKTASLIVEFGIAKDGRVPFITVRQSSGWPIYDDYAVNAIKLAAPFPPIPDAVSRTGMPVLARFNYIVDTSLTNLLR
jgi:TonB family protein